MPAESDLGLLGNRQERRRPKLFRWPLRVEPTTVNPPPSNGRTPSIEASLSSAARNAEKKLFQREQLTIFLAVQARASRPGR